VIGQSLLVGLALLFPGAAVDAGPRAAAAAFANAQVIEVPGVGTPTNGFYQVVIERQLIIRIPAKPSSINNFTAADAATVQRRVVPQPIVWRETKAPKCVPMRSLLGIQAVQRDSIDLITRENQRLRARLNRGCRALDFYSGFYMKASKDGRLCADRDALHARSGAECEVERFRLMVPARGDD
jgi:hypothetical protein